MATLVAFSRPAPPIKDGPETTLKLLEILLPSFACHGLWSREVAFVGVRCALEDTDYVCGTVLPCLLRRKRFHVVSYLSDFLRPETESILALSWIYPELGCRKRLPYSRAPRRLVLLCTPC